MKRIFNVAGPCRADEHYMLRPEDRCPGIMDLIDAKQYFIIHAPRQSGKTTMMLDLTQRINEGGKYYALYCSVEMASVKRTADDGIPELLGCLRSAIEDNDLLKSHANLIDCQLTPVGSAIRAVLKQLCKTLDRPLVVFFDEADGLQSELLISFLRQLRDGYITRNEENFPISVALIGLRNLRDYRASIREGSATLGTASPFNIITESRTLKEFTRDEITELYRQHTKDTGQVFSDAVVDKVFELTCGQPWLVNAIAREIVLKLCGNDFTKTITPEMVDQAAKNIIIRRDTHVDCLADKLHEPRVKKVIEPILAGAPILNRLSQDFQYVKDLGLITETRGVIQIANPIYNEVITRTLNYDIQMNMSPEYEHRWIDTQGRVDMKGLMVGFQEFWREFGDIWRERADYKEPFYQLIVSAFLQRVINSGGRLRHEYASGTDRVDLCIIYGENRYCVELKVKRNNSDRALNEGREQLRRYMNSMGLKEGWLIICDQRPALPKKKADREAFEIDEEIGVQEPDWSKRLYQRTEQDGEYTYHIVGV